MLERIKENTLRALCRLRIKNEVQEDDFQHKEQVADVKYAGAGDQAAEAKTKPVRRDAPKVGRNDPCPCGSGRKYKKCCGR
jgi:preprotein translocase subunit SecA